jgi:copper resistance protein D
LTSLLIAAKFLLYASTLMLIGSALHKLTRVTDTSPSRTNTFCDKQLPILAIGIAATLFFLLNAQLNGSLARLFSTETLSWIWLAKGKQTSCLIAGCLAVMLSKRVKWLLPVGVLLLVTSFTLTGHIQTTSSPLAAGSLLIVHLLIASFWIAAPITLWPRPNLSQANIIKRTNKFSQLATRIIGLLFVTGAIIAYLLLNELSDLVSTTYGRLLLIKTFLALTLLSIGALNKFYISKILIIDNLKGRSALKRTLSLEALLFVGTILILAFATTVTGPGK